ncbi:MAG TPA: peptide chain release factor N(5)-glutamine methyltransferase [Terriglobia bacterium]|nr:peptide chain release factor N(5)-glutamine methyltransferase [Terriglobia bacterium]
MKIHEALARATSLLEEAACPHPRMDAEFLLRHSLEVTRSFLVAHSLDELGPSSEDSFFTLIRKRSKGMPIQYIVGKQEFCGLEFEVDQSVLIPRPESELLVEEVLKSLSEPTTILVDVGTGSGCIAIAVAAERPGVKVVAIDVSEPALNLARRNARKLGVAGHIQFLQGDLLEPLISGSMDGKVDCVCSNPPYVAEGGLLSLQREVRDWEPRIALAAGENGLQIIERLVPQALVLLKPGGILAIEIGYSQQDQVTSLFKAGWQAVRVREDLNGIPRIVVAKKSSILVS